MADKHSKNSDENTLNKLNNNEQTNKKPKKKHTFRNVLLIILIVLILLFLGIIAIGYRFMNNKLDKMEITNIPEENLSISDNEILEEYRNIAIFGIDSRADEYGVGNRSDCIIIANINNKTKDVKLISVYRDTYVQIDGYGLDKITHAYSYGGEELAIKTLNKNLDLNIKEFVTVNFDAVAEIVDQLGGIQITIEPEEIKYINGYIRHTAGVTGKEANIIEKAGTYTLDGVQAVSYSRIRYTEGGDYKRTERMRDVLMAIVDKLKTKNLAEINNIADKMLSKVYTNITIGDIIKLLPSAMNFKITESIGWPYNVKGITLDRWYGVPVTLESNVIKLHKEAFGDEEYKVPKTVKDISNKIISKTGYGN